MSSKHDKKTHKHKTDTEVEVGSMNTASITDSGNSINHVCVDSNAQSKVHSSAEAEAEQEQEQEIDDEGEETF